MWENSPQKPLLTTRKWFFGHCYVQNAYFLTRISSKYLNSYIFWTGSLRRFRKGRTLNQASQRDLGCLQHHCAHLRWHFIPHTQKILLQGDMKLSCFESGHPFWATIDPPFLIAPPKPIPAKCCLYLWCAAKKGGERVRGKAASLGPAHKYGSPPKNTASLPKKEVKTAEIQKAQNTQYNNAKTKT